MQQNIQLIIKNVKKEYTGTHIVNRIKLWIQTNTTNKRIQCIIYLQSVLTYLFYFIFIQIINFKIIPLYLELVYGTKKVRFLTTPMYSTVPVLNEIK